MTREEIIRCRRLFHYNDLTFKQIAEHVSTDEATVLKIFNLYPPVGPELSDD